MIISIPIKVQEEFIRKCQAVKDAKTDSDFYALRIGAESYSQAIKDILGLSVWAQIVMAADMEIGEDDTPVCCGVPMFKNPKP